MKQIVCLFAVLLSIHFCQAQDFTAYKKQEFVRGKDILHYRILYPENYTKGKAYPLVVFLHGAGERGNDNEHQLDLGAALFLSEPVRKQFPAIVVFPQCPTDSFWNKLPLTQGKSETWNRSIDTSAPTTPGRLVKLLMDSLVAHKIADKERIYIGGLSLGGFGAYNLVIHYPNYFAAAFTICGQANVQLYVKKAANVPIWIFHGEMDDVVPPQPDRDLYKALIQTGAKHVRYSEYPGVEHNSWVNAFAEPALLPWLFSFKNIDR